MEEIKIVLENLEPDRLRLADGAADLYAHMDDCAVLLLRAYGQAPTPDLFADDVFVQLYREMRAALQAGQPGKKHSLTAHAIQGITHNMYALCGAMLCDTLCRRVGQTVRLSLSDVMCGGEESEVLLAQNRNRVVLLPNAMAASALERFRRVLPHLTESDCSDANEVCEEVYAGRAKYAILPVESSADGALKRFAAIIERYELKTVLTCSVQDAQREQFTRFALLARSMENLSCGRHGTEQFFACSIHMTDPSKLTDVLVVAEYFGLRSVRVDSVPLAHNSAGCTFSLVFARGEGDDLLGFYCYLLLEQAGFVPGGSYTQLK